MLNSYQLNENETYFFKFVSSDKCAKVLLTNVRKNGNALTLDSYLVLKFETGEIHLFSPKNEIGYHLYLDGTDLAISNFVVSNFKLESDSNDDAEALKLVEKFENELGKKSLPNQRPIFQHSSSPNKEVKTMNTSELFSGNDICYKLNDDYQVNREYIVKTKKYGSVKAVLLKMDSNQSECVFHFSAKGTKFVVTRGLRVSPIGAHKNKIIYSSFGKLKSIEGKEVLYDAMCQIGSIYDNGLGEYGFPGAKKGQRKESYSRPRHEVRQEGRPSQPNVNFNVNSLKNMLVGKAVIITENGAKLCEDVYFDIVELDGNYDTKLIIS